MELVTSTVFSPGGSAHGAFLDQLLVAPRLGLLAVADAGKAGSEGRAAVRLALDAVRGHVERNEDILDRFRRHPAQELRERILGIIEEGFTRAAQELFAFARRYQGLRVSLDVALILGSEAFVGHVGDGRVYLVRRGLVHQLTVDHARGDETEVDEARRGRPVRALGAEPAVKIEALSMEVVDGDRFFVTSHAAQSALPEPVLHQRLISEPLDGLAPALISAAPDKPLVGAGAQLGGGEASQAGAGRSRLAILAPIPMFAHCSERELRAVAAATRPRRFPAQTVLFRKGDPGTELFLVISGGVRIENDGKPIVTLGAGSNFGEMAMLDEPRRSADAITVEDTEVLIISREAFFALLKGNPMLAVKILWNMLLRLSARLRSTSARLTELTEALTETDPPPRTQPHQPPAKPEAPDTPSQIENAPTVKAEPRDTHPVEDEETGDDLFLDEEPESGHFEMEEEEEG